jgi:glycosyltransferase involved in cell wall biosynthesis
MAEPSWNVQRPETGSSRGGAPPEVSIVLPFHNAAATLAACLDSIQRQTLGDFELLAINDGSDDGSERIVAERARSDPRIHLREPGRTGLVAALNLGIDAARAALIARMDADDLMHPDRLRLQCDFLHQHPEIALVATRVRLFPEERIRAGYREYVRWQNACLLPEEIAANIYVESPLAHPSVMLRRGVLRRLGGYADGPFPEDYELWLRLERAGYRMAKLPRTLLCWHERDARASRVDPRYSRPAFDSLRADFLARDSRVRRAAELVIWGAGRKTRRRVRLLLDRGVRASAWVDIDPRKIGRMIWGLPVHSPDWLRRESRPFVLVYVTTHGARERVAQALERWGYHAGRDFLAVG